MLIIDGHEDLAYNGVELARDVTTPVTTIREAEGMPLPHQEGTATVSLPALRAGNVRVIFATLFTYPAGSMASPPRPGYHSAEEAYHRARAQVTYYQRLHDRGEARILLDQADLRVALEAPTALPGLCLLMEGADPLRTPADLAQFAAWGVRIVGLAWKGTRYAGGSGMPGPLTDAGRDLLREMDRLGIVLDVSHLADEAFWQAMKVFHGRVIASHANCRALVPDDRQLSDEMIRAIADRDGVVGLVAYNRFIVPGWTSARGKMAVGLDDLRRHADHIRALVGIRHVALGSDLDGGIGREDAPREIDRVSDLPRFADTLSAAGYAPDEVAAVMGGNWLRVLLDVLAGPLP